MTTETRTGTTPAEEIHRIESSICNFFASGPGKHSAPRVSLRTLEKTSDRQEALETFTIKVGPRYLTASLGNFEIYDPRQTEAIERATNFAADMPRYSSGGAGLMLFGPAGTGKDHLLVALCRIAIVRWGFSVDWFDGQELFATARHAISEDAEHKLMQRLVTPSILALSDPQPPRGQLSQYQNSLLRDAIDRRYRLCRPTWVTTNLDSPKDAESVLTLPLLQRLREGAVKIACDWESFRDRRKAKV